VQLTAPSKGKIERFFRTVRDQFLVELTEERAALALSIPGGPTVLF
jgi:hypothetical protein